MQCVLCREKFVDMEWHAFSRFERTNALINLAAELAQLLDMQQQLSADLLLVRFRQRSSLAYRAVECFTYSGTASSDTSDANGFQFCRSFLRGSRVSEIMFINLLKHISFATLTPTSISTIRSATIRPSIKVMRFPNVLVHPTDLYASSQSYYLRSIFTSLSCKTLCPASLV